MNNYVFLIVVFIFKIIILLALPIYILFFYKKEKNRLIIIEIVLLSILIILRIFNNTVIVNSSFGRLKELYRENIYTNDNSSIIENEEDFDVYITDQIYKTKNGSNVYYFNNNSYPLNNKRFYYNGTAGYLKHYGTGITALSMTISSLLDSNIDPIELLNLSIKNNIIDKASGIDMNKILELAKQQYNFHYFTVGINEMDSYVKAGKVVLAKVKYNENSSKNLFCTAGYIVIYNVDNNNSYYILNPNTNGSDILCPDNTAGALTVIKDEVSNSPWTMDELNMIVDKYYYLERN